MIDVSRPNFSLSSPRIVYDSQTTTAENKSLGMSKQYCMSIKIKS